MEDGSHQVKTQSEHGAPAAGDHNAHGGSAATGHEPGAGEHAGHGGHGGHGGHDDHGGHDHSHHVEQFRRLFWVMLGLSVPVVGLNEAFADLLGYSLPDLAWLRWGSSITGTVLDVT